MVYATWDEDGVTIDPITNRQISHKKGDWKISPDGNLYIETLGGREVYGKQVVNPLDVLTKEGTAINKVDFFDSDGKDKSVVGTTIKLAAEVAPFLIPGFNIFYGGVKMAMGLASVLPTFYKSFEGLLLGDSDGVETTAWKAMNSLEGFMKKYEGSLSDEAQKSMWNYEQLGTLVSDVFSQIYEQRAAASLSKLFYKVNDAETLKKIEATTLETIKDAVFAGKITDRKQAELIAKRAFNKGLESSAESMKRSVLAKNLSLGYMALTQASDVYSEALAAGYDRRTAGFTSLLAASGQYALMSNNQMGTWFLDKTTGYAENESKAAVKKVIRELMPKAKESIDAFAVNKTVGKQKLAGVFRNFKSKIDDLVFEPVLESEFAENIFKRGIIEGIEEVTEQAAIDAAKGITDFMSYMGVTSKQGSFGGFSNVFSKEGLERYVMNFAGGLIGGPMFELERSVISPKLMGEKLPNTTQADVYSLVANGRAKELLAEIDNRKNRYGNTDLAPIAAVIDGEEVFLPKENISQADIIAQNLKGYIVGIDKIINSEKLNVTNEDAIKQSIIDQIYINDITKSGVDKFILSDLNKHGQNIVKLRDQLDSLSSDTDKNGQQVSELSAKLREERDLYNEIMSGKKAEYYHGLALFTLNPLIHKAFLSLSVDEFVKSKYNLDYYKLTTAEQQKYDKEYAFLKEGTEENAKEKFKFMYESFLKMNENFSKSLKDYDADGYATVKSGFFNILHTLNNDPKGVNFIKALSRLNEVNLQIEELNKDGLVTLPKHKVEGGTFVSVGKFLVDNGFIGESLDRDTLNKLSENFVKNASKLLNIEESEISEELIGQINYSIEINRGVKALQDAIPGFENLSEIELYNVLTSGKIVIDGEEVPVDLSNVSQGIITSITNGIEEASVTLKVLNDIALRLSQGQEVSEEELATVGLVALENSEQTLQSVLNEIQNLNDVLAQKDTIKNQLNYNPELETLASEYESESKKLNPISEENKETIASIIDRVNLPSGDLDTNLIQAAIDDYLGELTKLGEVEAGKITEMEEGEQKQMALMEFVSKYNLPNFKVNPTDDLIFSPKRSLLLQYAEEVISKGEALDNEVISELKEEEEKLSRFIESYYQFEMDPTYAESYEKIYEEYKRVAQVLEYGNRKINTLYEKLRQFEIELFGWTGPVSIFKVLSESETDFNELVTTEADFTRTEAQLAQINRALDTISMVKSVLHAMSTTQWGVDNLYGMNVMLNKALEKEKLAPKYEYVGSQAYDTILKDLQFIEAKLEYFKELSGKNSRTIIENDKVIQDAVLSGLDKQYLDKNNPLSLLNLQVTINGKTYHLFSSDDLSAVNAIEDKEKKIIEIENRVYNNFHKIEGDVEEKLDLIFSPFISGQSNKEEGVKVLLDQGSSNLTADFKELTSFDLYKHLHFVLAFPANNFYNLYKNNLEKELSLSEKKAPLFTQLLTIREAIGYISNKNVVGHISRFLTNNLEGYDKSASSSEQIAYIIKEIEKAQGFRIDNVLSILGSGGTGKSSVIANTVLRFLQDSKMLGEPIEVLSIAPTHETLETLNKDLKGESLKDLVIQSMTVSDFIKSLLTTEGVQEYEQLLNTLATEPETLEESVLKQYGGNNKKARIEELNKKLNTEYFVAGEGSGAIVIREKFFDNFIKKEGDPYNPKVLVGDELSKISTLEWQILNYISKPSTNKTDRYYSILMGDNLQGGVLLGNQSFSYDNIISPATIKMKNPIRAKNDVQNQNNVVLENYTEAYRKALLAKGNALPNPVTLGYYESADKFLTGTKFVESITEADLRKLDPAKQIAVITRDGTMSNELRDLLVKVFGQKTIPIIKFSDVQGREFDQVVIDNVDLEKLFKQPFETVRQFYTVLTRAKEATLANIKEGSARYKVEKKAGSVQYTLDPKAIENHLKNRKSYLDSLDLSNIEISEEEVKPIEKPKEVIVDEEKDPSDESTPIINNPTPIQEPVPEDELPATKKDMNKSLAYSFFNNLGVKYGEADGPNVLENLLNVKIVSNPTNDSEMT